VNVTTNGRLRPTRPGAICAIGLPLALLLLSGCGLVSGSSGTVTIAGTAGPAGVGESPSDSSPVTNSDPNSTPTSSRSPRPTDTSGGSGGSGGKNTGSTKGKGCAAGGASIPPEADLAQAGDLDGDGKGDTLWIGFNQNDQQTFGVQTASGARFSMRFSTVNDPQRASSSVWGDRLGDGTAVILLDTSNEVRLYAVVDCSIVVTRNKQNNQYIFDRGNLGNGTGVGCPVIGSTGRHLVGYLAEEKNNGYSVSRTAIVLSQGGRRATNGSTTVLGTALSKNSTTVLSANNVGCGVSRRAEEQAS
jgi:hypothetical protein